MTKTTIPVLSVGLPVRNGMPFLEESLLSILNGEYQDYELIVCDNASTDGTPDLLAEYAARDERIRVIRNKTNIGVARNFNLTFSLAHGRYFRWMAADDLHSPGAIARCVEALGRETDAVLAFPETRVIDCTGTVVHDYDDGDGWSAASPVDRFACSLEHFGLSTRVYGVIRTEVLRQGTLQGDYPAGDLVMQTDLAIRGRFIRVRGEYFYRRIHQRSTQNLDAVELAQFYDPERTTAFPARYSRMYCELARLVVHAPVSAREKLQIGSMLARHAFWNRTSFVHEIGNLIMRRAGPADRRRTAPKRKRIRLRRPRSLDPRTQSALTPALDDRQADADSCYRP